MRTCLSPHTNCTNGSFTVVGCNARYPPPLQHISSSFYPTSCYLGITLSPTYAVRLLNRFSFLISWWKVPQRMCNDRIKSPKYTITQSPHWFLPKESPFGRQWKVGQNSRFILDHESPPNLLPMCDVLFPQGPCSETFASVFYQPLCNSHHPHHWVSDHSWLRALWMGPRFE